MVLHTPAELNAVALHKAMKGHGIKENILIDILCTAKNEDNKEITNAFKKKTGNSLEEMIEKETSGDFKRVLIAILQARRETGCDETQARQDAMELYKAGEKKIGTDEITFTLMTAKDAVGTVAETLHQSMEGAGTIDDSLTYIILAYSEDNLERVKTVFDTSCKKPLVKTIKRDTSGDFRKFLWAIFQ
ncbi:hypothetical protein ACTXT7_007276 [Hymenolepis weldensis]